MNDKDMEYLGNINTSPGPNAGRSIDPTKPEPDASAMLIEKVARAIAQVRHGSEGYRDEDDGVQYWELCIDEACAAIDVILRLPIVIR
jgi:hypothetical protein